MRTADPRIVQLKFPASAKPADPPAPSKPGSATSSTSTEPRGIKRAKGQRVDWEGVEGHYRAGLLTLREIGEMFDVKAPSIVQHAAKHAWKRNLAPRIDARVERIDQEAMAQETIDTPEPPNGAPNPPPNATTSLAVLTVVEAVAQRIAGVRAMRRERFGSMATLATKMFMELAAQFDNRVDLATLGNLMDQSTPEAVDKLNEIYMQAIALPGQIKSFKDLTEIITKISEQESKEFKLDKQPDEGSGGRANLPVRFVGTQWVERVDDDPAAGAASGSTTGD